MITVTSPLTLTLAQVFGVYMIAAGLSGLVAPNRWRAILDGFQDSPALAYVCGVFVFALGVAILLAHSIWTDPLSVIVTLFGWAAVIEGLIFIIAPGVLLKFAAGLLRPGGERPYGIAALLGGALLLIAGLIGRA